MHLQPQSEAWRLPFLSFHNHVLIHFKEIFNPSVQQKKIFSQNLPVTFNAASTPKSQGALFLRETRSQ